jgi:hypothetical protein
MENSRPTGQRMSREEAAAFVDNAVKANPLGYYLISRAPLNIMLVFFVYWLATTISHGNNIWPEAGLIISITLAIFVVYPEYKTKKNLFRAIIGAAVLLCMPILLYFAVAEQPDAALPIALGQLIVSAIVFFRPIKRLMMFDKPGQSQLGKIQ